MNSTSPTTDEQPGSTGETDTTSGATDPVDPTTGPSETTDTSSSEPDATTSTSTEGPDTDGPVGACPSPCDRTTVHMGDLTIEPGDSTDDLVCVTHVTGDVKIFGAVNEAALAGLSGLEKVDGLLRIDDNPELTGLAPFSCLREVGELQLADMPALADLSALAGLTAVGKFGVYNTAAPTLPTLAAQQLGLHTLELTDNPAMENLDVLATWTASPTALSVRIEDMSGLKSVAGLAGPLVSSAGGEQDVYILNAENLASLSGLEPLVKVKWVYLDGLPLVADLAPLAKLEKAGSLKLNGMPLVTSLTGLAKVKQIENLVLGGCVNGGPDAGGMGGLTSLAGLDGLATLDTLSIANSDKMSTLEGAPMLKGKLAELHLVNNAQLDDADVDTLVAQLGEAPAESCVGEWDMCQCIVLMPP